ncbi:MAG TPA: DUF6445 family protein [Steroidobacteraceae bacterium]|jgi:hypothetical protein|nr:DUF6445 family protein [Steroidobacteraceae bacterium]
MLDLNGKLRLHEHCAVSAVRVGAEQQAVVVVDNFLSDPGLLVDLASESSFDSVSDAFYPGCRAPIPPIYCFAIRAFLSSVIAEVFSLAAGNVTGELSHFSLVTTPPQKLKPVQRMPHYDTTNPKQLAVLHYLCEPKHGGTSFYRHRHTNFEFVDEARAQTYATAVAAELPTLGATAATYICGDDSRFERTRSFPAAFNRVLIYQSINLHSADIGAAFAFDTNPRAGRLTANSFFFYR